MSDRKNKCGHRISKRLGQRDDRRWLTIYLGMAAFAYLVNVEDPHGPIFFRGKQLPEPCMFHRVTGHRCPACGLSHGFTLMFHGRIESAHKANRASPLLFIGATALAIQSAKRVLATASQRAKSVQQQA